MVYVQYFIINFTSGYNALYLMYVPLVHIDLTEAGECKPKRKQRQPRHWMKEFDLYVSDRISILSGEWLTDAVINCWQTLLKEQYPHIGGLQKTGLGDTLTYRIETGEFVQIMNDSGTHWITVSNLGCLPNHFNVYDSIQRGDTSSRVKQQICALVYSDAKEIILKFPSVQFQKGGSDCGLFSIAFATSLCTGFDPSDLYYNQDLLREHLFKCVENKYLSPFPCTMKKRPKSNSQQTIAVYCLCRQPEVEGESMVQCDKCDEWYHNDCITCPSTCDMKSVKWFCPNCIQTSVV